MTKRQYTITISILIVLIVLSTLTILNKRLIGQKLQALYGVNPFLDYMTTSTIKNNNPLNIRHDDANKWMGEITTSTTKNNDFSVFDTLEHGIRAAIINLHTFVTKDGANTIQKIIARWAPPSDNNDDIAYEKVVMTQLNKIYPALKSTTTLDGNYSQLANIAWAMSAMEQGYKHQPLQQTFIDTQKKYF